LILLTKLENQEYESIEEINFSQLVNETLEGFEELLEMKSITLQKQIEPHISLRLHPVLASILLNNLFSNAIRHNICNGTISVTLTPKKLYIENTGKAPSMPTEELFRRFKKENPDSIGLGLSIVKQICELHFLKSLTNTSTIAMHLWYVSKMPKLKKKLNIWKWHHLKLHYYLLLRKSLE
jgi:signal transduction histidine kinase